MDCSMTWATRVAAERAPGPATATAAAALIPRAREFLPWWRLGGSRKPFSADAPAFVAEAAADAGGNASAAGSLVRTARRRAARNHRVDASGCNTAYWSRRLQRQNIVNKTIFIRDIDHSVTEEMLSTLFWIYGTVVDCRICGDHKSGLKFAFVEFEDEDEAYAALSLDGAIIGVCPIRVSPSRTAIAPINPRFLPQSEAEIEMCSRTVYCTNVSKTVKQRDLKAFCEGYFGEVCHLKLIANDRHSMNTAFIEFAEARGAIAALTSYGVHAGGMPVRMSPSKTPIRAS